MSIRPVVQGALGALALAALTVVPAGAAHAAVPSGPTAVAVGPDGTSYAGTAAGGTLTRVDVTGAVLSAWTLPRTGPVDALTFDPDGNLWVSYGYGASELSSTGSETMFFDYGVNVPDTCPATDADDPSVYGDLAVTADSVYVAQRCGSASALSLYSRQDYTQRAGISPLGGRIGEIAIGPASGGVQGTAIYVTQPDAAQVLVFDGVYNHAMPIRTIPITAQGGGTTPRPTGIAVDDQGQLFVTDSANHVIYVYNNGGTGGSNNGYDRYIGNPPDPDTYQGGFSDPTALAQYPRTGTVADAQGNLFVADSGNNRIQRLNTYGYSFWAAPTDGSTPPAPGSAPVNTTLPSVGGTPTPGSTLTCDPGTWAGAPTSFSYGWNRDGSYIPEVQGQQTYAVSSSDVGHKLTCYVQAHNASGDSGFATSAPVTVTASSTPSAPVNQIAPTIDGTPQPGATLVCHNGTWSGNPAPTYTQQWNLDGTPIAGATQSSYTVADGDLGHVLTCTVTATNSQGSASSTSAGLTVTATTPPSPCTGVANTVSINNGADLTNDRAVTLRIRPPAGATQVLISNDGGFDTAAVRALSSDCTYPWTLTNTGAYRDGKTVYVRFAGGGHSPDDLGPTDDILLDATNPALPTPKAVQATKGKPYTVTLGASDKDSGLGKVQYAQFKNGTGTTVAYRRTFSTTKPWSFTWIRVFDKAGNASPWKQTTKKAAR